MNLIGIAGRLPLPTKSAPTKFVQTTEYVRRTIQRQDGLVGITLLPDGDFNYADIVSSTDPINTAKINFILDKCDGFILPGGSRHYSFDDYIIRHALNHDKPLLAICLGFQILCNYFADGQPEPSFSTPENPPILSTESDQNPTINHLRPWFTGNTSEVHQGHVFAEYRHKNHLVPNTKLGQIIGAEIIPVNSLHQYCVNFPLRTLVKNAFAEDGTLEGVEHPDKTFIIGTQWHPEALSDEPSTKLFQAFAEAVHAASVRDQA